LVLGSDPAVEDDAAGAVEEAAKEGAGAAAVGVRRRHNQDIFASTNWSVGACVAQFRAEYWRGAQPVRGEEVVGGYWAARSSGAKRRACVCRAEGSGVYVVSEPIRSEVSQTLLLCRKHVPTFPGRRVAFPPSGWR